MSQPANDEFSQHLSDDEASNHEDASDTGAAPKQQQRVIPQTTAISNIKLPILKKEEYDIWAMEMELYLEYIDNDVWKVIQNGNSKKRILTGNDGVIRILPPVTAAEIQAVEKERKAKNILLMAIPKEHMRRFHGMDDAKEIWEAIRTRFGGNANSKKMQKVVFKQQFEAFTISRSEGLEKGYDRFQQLLSQLEAHGAEVLTEDANHKFLRSLPPAWSNLAMTMRTKPDVDTLSIDDLYNNLRVFEQEIQGASKTSSSAQNVAFVSQSKCNTNKVKSDFTSAYNTCTPSTSSTNIPEKEALASFADEVIYSLFAKQSEDWDLLHEDLEHIDDLDIKEMDINWQIAMIAIRMNKSLKKNRRRVGECTAKGTHDGKKKRDSFYQHQEAGKQEKNQMGLLTMDDGIVNWGEHTEDEETNHALMIISSSSEDNVQFCLDRVCTVSSNVNTIRSRQPIPIRTSNSFSPKTTAQMSHSHAVKGNWGSAVKTSAGYNWRNSKPNSNCDSGPTFIRTDHPLKNMVDRGIFDSGCSGHMTGNKDQLEDFEEFNGGSVTFGGSKGYISGKGKIRVGNLDFDSVSFVKELGHFNLFSISQICDKQHKVLFTETECLVVSSDFKMPDENQILLKVPRHHNMYSFDMKTPTPAKGFACLIAKATSDESKLWHRRLGHINFKNLNKLVKGNLVRGLPSKVFKNDHTCVACHKGKQHRASCKAKLERLITEPLHTLHMDLFGPTSVKSINHASYCLVITDDCTRFSWVFFLASKDETSGILQNFIRQIENQLSHRVKIIRSDNGTEFKNRDMLEFCGNKGIKQEYSNARTPQQNGVAERMNRTLIEAARTMLADSLLPTTFWAEAVSTACYIFNRILSVYLAKDEDVELIVVPSAVKNTEEKVESRTSSTNSKKEEILTEPQQEKKASSTDTLEDNPKILALRRELEEIALKHLGTVSENNSTSTPSVNTGNESVNTGRFDPDDSPMPELEIFHMSETGVFDEASYDEEGVITDFNSLPIEIEVSPTPTLRIHNIHPKSQILGDPKSAVQTRSKVQQKSGSHALFSYIQKQQRNNHKDQQHCLFACFLSQEEPKKISEALQDDSWVQAMQEELLQFKMQEELLQFKLQQVWVLVDLPHGMKVISIKWVYKNKRDKRGVVVRNKARLVAQGYMQEEGINYDEVFAHVIEDIFF
ncbi:putative ribonuclease H-like domain-containing protein [Tanacetum coccineum]